MEHIGLAISMSICVLVELIGLLGLQYKINKASKKISSIIYLASHPILFEVFDDKNAYIQTLENRLITIKEQLEGVDL